MPKPLPGTYPEYFDRYISQVNEDDAITALENQHQVVDSFFDAIPEAKEMYAYAEGKWTIKEVLQHIIDAERIFIFRALCFARQESQSLPGFDENSYAANSNANAREWQSLCEEIKAVRKTTIQLYESFTDDMLQFSGNANNKPTSANTMGFVIAGHLTHHIKIITERYL
ncbi:MAG: DinB family protein [Ferruginibacter sp.]